MAKERKQLSSELRIEHISRSQFREFLAWNWWLSEPKIIDLGEDETIEIYDNGEFSGIKFLAQVKGTERKISSLMVYDRFLSWSVEYRQLDRWDRSTVPVIFVIWNINDREGYWVDIQSEIKRLESKNPIWRSENRSFNIQVPVENKLEKDNLFKLRHFLAEYYYPSYSRNKNLEMTISFSYDLNNSENIKAEGELENFLAHGDPLTIESKYISAIKHSDWYERLMGIQQPIKLLNGVMQFNSVPEGPNLNCRVDFIGRSGKSVSFRTVLVFTQSGTDSYDMTNEKDVCRIKIKLRFFKKEKTNLDFQTWISGWGIDVIDTELLFDWQHALEEGGTLSVIGSYETGEPFEVEGDINPGFFRFDIPPRLETFIRNLSFIQRKLHQRLTIENIEFTDEDEKIAQDIFTLLEGKAITIHDALLNTRRKQHNMPILIEAMNKGKLVHMEYEQKAKYKLLGQHLELGTTIWKVDVASDFSPEVLETIYKNGSDDDEILLHIFYGEIHLKQDKVND